MVKDIKGFNEISADQVDAMVDGLFAHGTRLRDEGDMKAAGEMLRTGMRMFRNDFQHRIQNRELRDANAELEEVSSTDALTRLPNLNGYNRAMKHELDEIRRFNSHAVSLAFIDLDGFKAINDTFGHDMGDNILREVSRCLEETFRTTDIVCRIGGDELVVIMPHKDNQHFDDEMIKNYIRDSIAGLHVVWDEEANKPYPIGASIGIATSTDPELDGLSETDDLMAAMKKLADERMYMDKWRNGEYTSEDKEALHHPKNLRLEALRVKAMAHREGVTINGPFDLNL